LCHKASKNENYFAMRLDSFLRGAADAW